MIKTGADIVDIDHLVHSMSDFKSLLDHSKSFVVKLIRLNNSDGSPELIKITVIDDLNQSNGRCIISAGCEITPGTSNSN